jgi:hypothetical protein
MILDKEMLEGAIKGIEMTLEQNTVKEFLNIEKLDLINQELNEIKEYCENVDWSGEERAEIGEKMLIEEKFDKTFPLDKFNQIASICFELNAKIASI